MMQQKAQFKTLRQIINTFFPLNTNAQNCVILHDYLLKMSNSQSRLTIEPITVNFGFNTVELTMVE